MKRVRVILILVVIVAVVAAGVAIYRNREPRYQGRTLSDWIESVQRASGTDSDARAAVEAVQRIGTNSVPWLLKWNVAEDSKGRAAIISWLDRHPGLHLHIRSAYDTQHTARLGMLMLGAKSKPAWPGLVQLTYDKDENVRYSALCCLSAFKADKEIFQPVLSRLVNDPSLLIQTAAAFDLSDRFPEEAEKAGVYERFPVLKPNGKRRD